MSEDEDDLTEEMNEWARRVISGDDDSVAMAEIRARSNFE